MYVENFLHALTYGDLWNIRPYVIFSPCISCALPLITVVVGYDDQDKDCEVLQVLVKAHGNQWEPQTWVGKCKTRDCEGWYRLTNDDEWRCTLCGHKD